MASYAELNTIVDTDTGSELAFKKALIAACQDLANDILDEASPTGSRRKWADATRDDPTGAKDEILWPILIENKGAALATILAATDATIKTAVGTQVAKRYGVAPA